MKILFFGQLVEVVGAKELSIEGSTDIYALTSSLHQQFPLLAQAKYVIAVDQEIISDNRNLQEHNIVAFMPPFSGG
ncbi:MAG: MoaD/ThiS family protein [Sediminibacterium sp.]|jgi:sulfur-carrier protein|uniref:MoaD/ThiS family protein n=1 Tax=Sediminibacterium sp. TaxID=1917865 RepID=UPI002ABCE87B|nr:MoaD/ThiS family protein [Sediminibacterium sp.]MDZ4073078.1 MoaD/ThiS family protein [Sediminibacterium sp.]